jgi:hypothetical protein
MITVIPRRYDSPKWQANVPVGQAFRFSNGLAVQNLYDLKQALSSLPEDIVKHHVNDKRHDLAEWIQYSVGDVSLAEAIRTQQHRWGMIVTLERHQMRTLNLPPYIAQRWLSPVTETFSLNAGPAITSLSELSESLKQVSDEAVLRHCERVPNDIAKWLNDCIGDYQLAEILAESTSRSQMSRNVEDHLAMLREAAS